jgi:hypothetical protein
MPAVYLLLTTVVMMSIPQIVSYVSQPAKAKPAAARLESMLQVHTCLQYILQATNTLCV